MDLTEITRIWRKAQNKISKWLKDKNSENEFTLTFRLPRHTYCTALYDVKVDEVSTVEIMGHDVSIMREIYTHIGNKRKQKTIKKLGTSYQMPKTTNKKRPNNGSFFIAFPLLFPQLLLSFLQLFKLLKTNLNKYKKSADL